ncbi:chemotaxis protein MotB [Izhakiella capsodis]|uniref:Chemotaxis protein MotB n=1 Tax=Izhakiella capsodis TaxID=1367852 RepID=A0A1I5B1F6_9GAMM|nr:chemotaxis protein MotB [Izhakiella capsodis]
MAFADFTLAMMALFMVLWIAATVNQEQRHAIAAELQGKELSTLSCSSYNPLHMHGEPGDMSTKDNSPIFSPAVTAKNISMAPDEIKIFKLNDEHRDNVSSKQVAKNDAFEDNDELIDLINKVSRILRSMDAQNNVTLESLPQGLRILIQDSSQRMMFTRGSAVMTPFFQRLLTELVPVFNQLDNHILINGHTDSVRYSDNAAYDNWNLSADRALAAQRVLKQAGLADQQIIQVSGMADSTLLDQDNPQADKNRRIEIMVLTKRASDALYELLGYNGQKAVQAAASKLK